MVRLPNHVYQPIRCSLPPGLDLHQVPITLHPTVVPRQVQGSARVSPAGSSYPFNQRHAGQTVTVTVNGNQATAQAADGWQRTWNLHAGTQCPRRAPHPAYTQAVRPQGAPPRMHPRQPLPLLCGHCLGGKEPDSSSDKPLCPT